MLLDKEITGVMKKLKTTPPVESFEVIFSSPVQISLIAIVISLGVRLPIPFTLFFFILKITYQKALKMGAWEGVL